jgi:hypothetical protein
MSIPEKRDEFSESELVKLPDSTRAIARDDTSNNGFLKQGLEVFFDARFYLWGVLLVAGFAYVAVVLCHRRMPFESRHADDQDISKLLLSIPFLCFLGPRHNLKRLDEGFWSILKWNAAGYALPYFVALHWFFLQRISVINYSLTWKDLSHMHPVGQVVFLSAGLMILGLVGYHIHLARKARVLAPYYLFLSG